MRILWMLLALLALIAHPLHAQQKAPVRFSIVPRGLTVRSNSPVDAEVDLRWDGEKLLEGRLELTFLDRSRVVGRYLSDEIAMATGGRKFRITLPPMKNFDGQMPLNVVPKFITRDSVTELGDPGDFSIRVPPEWKRSMVILTCEPIDAGAPGLGALPFDALRIEQFVPDFSTQTGIGTTVVPIEPQEMPGDGLNYFSYDLAVLAGDGFSQLKSKQLTAVADWVEAGGSVIVVPDRNLEDAHLKFLNRIGRAVPGESEFLTDNKGRLIENNTDTLAAARLTEPGLGRAVILPKPIEGPMLSKKEWRRIVAFLWKLRADEAKNAITKGKWSRPQLPQGNDAWNNVAVGPTLSAKQPYRPVRLDNSFLLEDFLRPAGIHVVSLSLVVTVLTLFLLVIGPGDYYLLGMLKSRKYTWVLFPLVSIGFTAFMVAIAQRSMGSSDYRNSLVFVDIGDDNRPVRTSRFESIRTGAQRTVDTPLTHSLYARFDPPRPELYIDAPYQDYEGQRRDQRYSMRPDLPLVEDRMPSSFIVRDELQKWSPKLNRYTSLGATVDVPEFDWNLVGEKLSQPLQSFEPIAEPLSAAFPDAEFFLLGGDQFVNLKTGNVSALEDAMHFTGSNNREAMLSLIRAISAPPPVNLLKYVAQMSPTGAGDFEDLAIFDRSDSLRHLLIIVTRQGDDWIVHRKVYTTGR